ncbi:MAG TPA: NAD(P)/FAD-dependent oxidoreductase [Mycobacteriales bacterium]|jgi:2-polyprenyl-6-methoxyphenol hydroxylase-like FAD-dependent oxidoreductase|nr:NAD(P)/FAD-dependent oxidoreductase [Mycobacteriales bacterium]
MRVAVVGAGVAGLTASLALQRDGHAVSVYESAAELRTGGFGLNLWTNAGSLLDEMGVDIPGEPYSHISFRAGGRHRATMRLPARGYPHVNVERGALLRAIEARLGHDTIHFATTVTRAAELLDDGFDLVVAADGVGSRLRPDASVWQKRGEPWAVWQVMVPTGADLIERGGGAVVLGKHRFYGIWRQPNNELCWFVEDPALSRNASAEQVLANALDDDDPLVREVAALTTVGGLGQWLARDRRPTREIIGDRIVAIGDAAHPMLPCIGQGACTSIEDGVALARVLRGASVPDALERYRRWRLPVTRLRVATAHFACTLRRPSPIATTIAATPLGVPFAHASGAWMRMVNRADRRLLVKK